MFIIITWYKQFRKIVSFISSVLISSLMPNKVSICLIKFEIDSNCEQQEEGAVSTEHPLNPRLQKERKRDRGLRLKDTITIESYFNKEMNKGATGLLPTSSRETTPLEEHIAAEFPKEITFFSGNPFVELTKGVMHLYKKNDRIEIRDGPSCQLCLLAVPANMSCHELLIFLAPCHSVIKHIRIVRDGSPNQFIVLLEFRSNDTALDFYRTYNGVAFNSLEQESVCHAVWVSEVEWSDDGIIPAGHTELPTCPVCLERMDESVDGVLTILCNHVFHANCLSKWGDSTCPVCRHVQTPELMENSVCMECEGTEALWICLICGHIGCGRYQGGHAAAHFRATNHSFAMQLGTSSVWDYAGDNFVHRLFQNKSDGKLVASNSPEEEREEKMDSMQLEYTYLLTSQLDTQRKYYEDKINQMQAEWDSFKISVDDSVTNYSTMQQKLQILNKEKCSLEKKLAQNSTKLKETQKLLAEEVHMSKALQENQNSWQEKYNAVVRRYEQFQEQKERELNDVKEQLRDIMFYMEAQRSISESDIKSEIVSGTVIVPEAENSKSGASKKTRKKKM